MGMNVHESNARSVLAHPTPRLLYIAVPNSGKVAPNAERMRSFPASTLAAYLGYASAR